MRNAKQLADHYAAIHKCGGDANRAGLSLADCPHTNKADSLVWRMGYNYQPTGQHCIYDGEWLNKRTA